MDENFKVKITDYGFVGSTEGKDKSGLLKSRVGTNGYKAPEIYSGAGYQGQPVDIFAAGVILFFLVCRTIPFQEAKPTDSVYKCISKNRADLFWRWHEKQLMKLRQQVSGDDGKGGLSY